MDKRIAEETKLPVYITDDPLTDYGLSELTGYMSRDTNDADASAILGGVSNVQRFSAEYNAQRNIARDGATNVVVNNGVDNMGKLDIIVSRTVDNNVKRTFGVYMGQTDNGYVMMKTKNNGSPHPDILIRSDNVIEIIDN